MDKETEKIVSDEQRMVAWANSSDWKEIVRPQFIARVLDLQNIMDITGTPEQQGMEMMVRRKASTALLDFLRAVEGSTQSNSEILKESIEKDFIVRL
jgi:hypothetical protein